MGTEFTIDLYAPSETVAEQAANQAFEEIARLEELLSSYRPSSELSRISRKAGAAPVTTDLETLRSSRGRSTGASSLAEPSI